MADRIDALTPTGSRMNENIVVLGAGLTGLCAALRANAPAYEAADSVGGVAASDRVDGFVFDRGIHVLQTRNQQVLDLLDEIGVQTAVHERNAHIYSHDCYTPYPFQINTAGLPLPLRIRCVWDFLRREENEEPANYEEWMYANLGRGLAQTFLIPYSEKFWGVPPAELTHDWTGNRVPKPSTSQVLRGALWNRNTPVGTNATFRYPVNGRGYAAIADALMRRAPAVYLSHRATAIDPLRRRIRFQDGREVGYRVLISTVPLPHVIDLLADFAPAEVREAVGRLRTNSILVVNLGVARANLSDRHWVHFPGKDISFFRISFPANFDPAVVPPGMSSISAEVAYSPDQPIDRAMIVERVIADLVKVGVLRPDDRIVLRATSDIPLAYCIYDKARKGAARLAGDWLIEQDIVTCGRYGLWAYFWSDEAMMSGLNAAGKALRLLKQAPAEPPCPAPAIRAEARHVAAVRRGQAGTEQCR
ncbi:MAG: FAD-dependent oxidoreductase [Acidobacteria bacterium]|nr:FAD-dependent oxidoreductase [Acidobacteriota bacterium]